MNFKAMMERAKGYPCPAAINSVFEGISTVTDEEMQAFYKENPSIFEKGENRTRKSISWWIPRKSRIS